MKTSKNRFRPGENRRIEVIDGRINYIYLKANKIAYCSDIGYLHDILSDIGLSPSMSSHVPDKIQFRKRKATEINGHCYLSELSYACYHGWIKSVETWENDLAKFRKWMRSHKYEIDHADCNQLNCTLFNLSLMHPEQNKSKNARTARINLPTIHFSGRYGKEYRIVLFRSNFISKTNASGTPLKVRCRTVTDYIDCLKVIEQLQHSNGKTIFPTKADREAYKNRPSYTSGGPVQTVTSIYWQAVMSEIDRREFCLCTGSRLQKMLLGQ